MHAPQQLGNLVCRKSRTIFISNRDSRAELGPPIAISNLRPKSFTKSSSSFTNGILKKDTMTSKIFSSVSTLRSAEISPPRYRFRCHSSLSDSIQENLEPFEGSHSLCGILLSLVQYFRLDPIVRVFIECFQRNARNVPYYLRFRSIRRFLRKEKESFTISLSNITNKSSFENNILIKGKDLGIRATYDDQKFADTLSNTQGEHHHDIDIDENDYGFFADFDDPSDSDIHLTFSLGTLEIPVKNRLFVLNEAEEEG
jgi:hypothetical protein